MNHNVRTRFAPSPTGFLHIGGVRTALFNYLYAKQNGGQFILRLEDTDRERFVEEGVGQIVEALGWLGLEPDEGFWISEGKHQNVGHMQSKRHNDGVYKDYAERLIEKGLAYYSPTTSKKLEELRQEAKDQKLPFTYKRHLDEKNSDKPVENAPIRLDIQKFFLSLSKDKKYKYLRAFPAGASRNLWQVIWSEKTGREIQWTGHLIDDFILIKSDGYPTYNFANVVDDHEMRITHVMRGDEFIASTAKHIVLYHALGLEESIPEFVHLPVINGTDGKKLSKRTGDTNVLDYRDKGYPPEALLNFLALLGWNDGTEQEIFTIGELIKKFNLQQINTSPAVFDQKRLDWISGNHIRSMKPEKLFENASGFWPEEAARRDEAYKKKVLGLVQERLKFFAELPELSLFFFKDLPVDPQLISGHKQLKKYDPGKLKQLLETACAEFEKISEFKASVIQDALNKLLDKTGEKPVVLFSLIRIATTRAAASPGLAETMEALSKDTCLARIDEQIKAL